MGLILFDLDSYCISPHEDQYEKSIRSHFCKGVVMPREKAINKKMGRTLCTTQF